MGPRKQERWITMPTRDEMKLLLRMLRTIHGGSQQELGTAASIDRTTISRFESGDMTPSRAHLTRLAKAAGVSLPFAESILLMVVRLLLNPAMSDLGRARPDAEGDALTAMERAVVETLRLGVAGLRSDQVTRDAADRSVLPTADDRLAVPALWARFAACGLEERRRLVGTCTEFQTWAFSERLCEQSAQAAAEGSAQALGLARLALMAAERAPGPADWKSHLRGHAWAFVGNALRAAGDLPAAGAALSLARTLWREGASGYAGLLVGWHMPALQASLARGQGEQGRPAGGSGALLGGGRAAIGAAAAPGRRGLGDVAKG